MKKYLLFSLWFVCGYALDMMSTTEISRGMRGVGYSVFSGWESEAFEVEIVDVMRGTTPEDTLILARLSGQNLEQTGIIAGMSGSPVYISNRLVGAVAYAWSFAKEALCGITPAELMVGTSFRVTKPFSSTKRAVFSSFPLYLWSDGRGDFLGFLSNQVSRQVSFLPMAGGKGVEKDMPSSLRPGDAVAVHLVDGDVRIQAIGTVTAVEGEKVWMFGHPLFQSGQIEAPFSRAYIYGVMPSYTVSFKLGTAGQELGSVVYDGAFAVEGRVGKKPDMLPVETTLYEPGGTNTYHYRVVRSPLYQAYFTMVAFFSLLESTLGSAEQHVIDLLLEAKVLYERKTNTLTWSMNSFYDRDAVTFGRLVSDVWEFLSLVQGQDRENVRIENLRIVLKKQPVGRRGFVERAWIERSTFQVGETMQISCVLRDNFSRTYRERFEIVLPAYLVPGKYQIILGNPQSVRAYIEKESKASLEIFTYRDVLQYYKEKAAYPATLSQLWCGVLLPFSSQRTARGEIPGLPRQYGEWLDGGPSVGKEKRGFHLLGTNRDVPFVLPDEVILLPITIQSTNGRSGS
ncbi:SpoIVB peptidase S55 domain-containing protein [Thermospira aquatica]|uniref:Peptidase S55 domain-containing protein n=1 Tax=Thermospira aquatica TaxID=2828656 RepID=A0AAX3BGD5_9SPIR|nr:SpoIVB peptidase S55 domain-containing protein [Thermospira aquatica]URA10486.1 hypothetical protein KDW03_01405 [Thermospira aquatica]